MNISHVWILAGICLPHTAKTHPFQCNFDAANLWMGEHCVCVRPIHYRDAQVLPRAMLTGLSVNGRKAKV